MISLKQLPILPKQNSGMKVNPITLSFEPELEKKFMEDYHKTSIKQARLAILGGILFYIGFGLLDFMIAADFLKELFFIRFVLSTPVLAITLALTFIQSLSKKWYILISIAAVVAGGGIIAMTLLENQFLKESYYPGLILVLILNFMITRSRFTWAMLSGWLLTLSYIFITFAYSDISYHHKFLNSFFLLSINILCSFGGYFLEYSYRRDFYHRILLKEESNKTDLINKSLEQKVEEKTRELQKDLNLKQKAERTLIEAKEKAEENDRLKSAFLANMSHEIRTPMNGIMGFTNLLSADDIDRKTKDEYIKVIRKSGERMLDTINDLINVSKLEAGLIDVHLMPENLNSILTDLYYFFQPEAAERKLEFELNNNLSTVSASILTDKEKVTSILTNLIKNAIKYTPEGRISFGFKQVESEGKSFIEFSISDTGIGIPENKQEAIFERFTQADINQNRAFEGFGLGLSICKSYVEMLGGKLWLQSKVAHGSTFYFSLPNRATHKSGLEMDLPSNQKESALEWLKGKDILIIEDDSISALYLKNLLRDKCNSIHTLENGRLAVEYLRANSPDIVFMDIRMPEMDGYTATKKIREFNNEVIIIAQTAYAMGKDIEQALKCGCNAHLSKPIDEKSLLKVIEKSIS